MDRKKKNSSLWPVSGLVLLLCTAFLVTATGTAFARYRSGADGNLEFEVRVPEQICFGTFDEDEKKFSVITDYSGFKWETDENGISALELTVANGSAGNDFSGRDQKVCFRIAVSPELAEKEVTLVIPENGSESIEIAGTANRIGEKTELYYSFGEGFVFTFEIEGEEYSRILEGGKFSHATIIFAVETAGIKDTQYLSLRPFAVAEVID